MDFFSRITPVYKTAGASKPPTHAQPQPLSGLAGLLGSLFGGTAPTYKTADGQRAQAPASSGFWQMFAVAPSYKTAHSMNVAPVEESPIDVGDVTDADAIDDAGDPGLDDGGAPCVRGPDEVVLL